MPVQSLAQKLRIKENDVLLTIDAPPEFEAELDAPDGVKLVRSGKNYDQVHWFVRNRTDMESQLQRAMKLLLPGIPIWIYYPKGSSGIQTDLTRDKGWDLLLAEDLQWLNLISFNDTWSAFCMRRKTEQDLAKQEKTPEREIFKWADPVTKTVRLPEDLAAAFKKDRSAGAAFEALAYSHKREYVEWIVTAKRPETRAQRIQGTMERLDKGWKNPMGR